MRYGAQLTATSWPEGTNRPSVETSVSQPDQPEGHVTSVAHVYLPLNRSLLGTAPRGSRLRAKISSSRVNWPVAGSQVRQATAAKPSPDELPTGPPILIQLFQEPLSR